MGPAGHLARDTATPQNLRKRLARIQRLAGPLEKRRVLDCGCGAGDYLAGLAALGAQAFGIERDRRKLRASARDDDGACGRLVAGDLERTPFADASFDVALMNEVLEHVPDERVGLAEIRRVLRPDGALLVFSPNRLYPFETHGVFLRDSQRRLAPATPFVPYVPMALGRRFLRYWARNYWPWQLGRLLRESGFAVHRRDYVWQTFENISGRQPAWMRRLRPWLRRIADAGERTPGLRALGVSQVVVARRVP